MAKTKQKTINKATPYIILVAEIIIFYGAAGWLSGVWRPGYHDESSDLHLSVGFLFLFGIFTFVVFVVVVPPPLVRSPFIHVTTIFVATALPSLLLSTALNHTLQANEAYPQSLAGGLAEIWKGKSGIFLPLAFHTLGFMAALGLRKTFNTTPLKSGS